MNKVRTATVVAAGSAAAVALVAAGKAIASARTGAGTGTPAADSAPQDDGLAEVARFDHQVTGIAVAAGGRRFVSFPRWTDDAPISVGELSSSGKVRAYPDAAWNAWRNATAAEMRVEDHFVCVQSIVVHGDALWVVDAAAPGNERIVANGPKLVKIDLATNRVAKVIRFDEAAAPQGSYLNDVRFAPDGRTAYLTDSGARGAIVVVDIDSGAAFRALDGHASTQAEPEVVVTIAGKPLRRLDGRAMIVGSDGLAVSLDGRTLYWQALTGTTLYAIETARLARGTDAGEAEEAVRIVGRSTVADGLLMSHTGTLYVTAPQEDAVKRWNGRQLETVVRDARLRWPDSLAEGPDGTIYVTASRIPESSWFTAGAPASLKTALYAFKPVA